MLIGADVAIVEGQFADPSMDGIGGAEARMKERPLGGGGEDGEGEGGADTGPAGDKRGEVGDEATGRRGEEADDHQRAKRAPKTPPKKPRMRSTRRAISEGGAGAGVGAGEEARQMVEELHSVNLAPSWRIHCERRVGGIKQ
jgi:hypothetical protein